jgi:hypothetical protein
VSAEVSDLLHRYATAIDTRRLELLRDVFVPGATEDFRRLGTKAEGVDAIIAFIASAIERWSATQHTLSNVVVDGASCSCYFVAYHVKPGGGLFEVGGAYYDRLVRTDDGLRIAERILQPIWER